MYSDDGVRIRSYYQNPKPFSTRITCGRCHQYGTVSRGWHFNGYQSEAFNDEGELVKIDWGRPGQPWVLTDISTRTQIPISGRKWPGTFAPEEVGMSSWEFLEMNSSYFPGGSYGEIEAEHPYELARQEISGNYEINCLACHSADSRQDQDMAALQAARQNYRWIPTASSHMGVVDGDVLDLTIFDDPASDSFPRVTYQEGLFDGEDMVFFDITGKPSNERCYFCHSNQDLSVDQEQEWTRDEDVHLKAGLNCVDCHRNGDDHMMTRGIESEGPGKTLTCEGCHVGEHDIDSPEQGRLGAPKPKHRGIPTIHFEKMTCTACHSGTWPAEEANRWKTARMHRTGLHGKHTPYVPQPHVYAPVLMKGQDGKIGPYKMFWPAYWGLSDGETITPIPPKNVLAKAEHLLDIKAEKEDDWRPLTEEQIRDVLQALKQDDSEPVYIAGGKLYQLDSEDKIVSNEHGDADPYAWPIAHDVRPAEQSLGVRLCKDCHTTDSPFFFGQVQVDTPIKTEAGIEFVEMIKLQGVDRLYMWMFNASFVFRPMLKIVAFISCGLICLVILAYFLRAVAVISNACAEGGQENA